MANTNKPTTDKDAPKRKVGAPPGNMYAVRHGLSAGKLPKKLQYVELVINKFRRYLEGEVTKVKGEVNLIDAATINSACKWERHAKLAEYWMRNEGGKLSATEKLKFSEAIAKASDQRDKNIRLLGLDVRKDVWAVVDGKTVA